MPHKEKYTDPELRDKVKQEVQESDKGGAPGQWSARKAQFMASEYKKRGGGYNTDKSEKDESQQNLSNWTEEECQTKEGSGDAKKEDGTEKRYLPKKAWEKMTEEQKEATDKKKQEECKEGKQYVENTENAKESRKKASKESNGTNEANGKGKDSEDKQEEYTQDNVEEDARENEEDDAQENAEDDVQDTVEDNGLAIADDDGEADYVDDNEANEDEDGTEDADQESGDKGNGKSNDDHDDERDGNEENAEAGQRRKGGNPTNGASKRQKDNSGNSKSKSNGTVGSKHMDAEEPGPCGSNDRLPKKGQQAQWKAMPGYVDGEVVEVLTTDKDVDGKSVKASKDDPKIVLKSHSSGKICVHKPDACFFD